jgi:hypothetical protein
MIALEDKHMTHLELAEDTLTNFDHSISSTDPYSNAGIIFHYQNILVIKREYILKV